MYGSCGPPPENEGQLLISFDLEQILFGKFSVANDPCGSPML